MKFEKGSDGSYKIAGGMRRRLILNVLAFAVMLYTLFFLFSACRASIRGMHIPNEYREPANFDLTLSFINGINPYALDSIGKEVPGMVYQYGPLFSLLVAGLHFVLPFVDIFALHYLVAFLCIIIAAFMAALIAYENSESLLPAASVFLFTIACTWRYGYINAVPDTLGVTLLVLVFFLETRKKLPGKEYLEAAVAVALFYTKQYFVIIALSLFIYKLITDRKAWIRLSISGIAMLVISMVIVNHTCPLYFTYSILIAHGVAGQSVADPIFSEGRAVSPAPDLFEVSAVTADPGADEGIPPTGWGFELFQLKSLVSIFLFVFAGMIAGVAEAFIRKMPRFTGSRLFVIHSAVAFAALLFLGQNDGAWLSYYLELLLPSVVIYSFISIEKSVMSEDGGKIYRRLCTVLMIFMVMYTSYRMDSRLPYYDKDESSLQAWERAYRICDIYAERGDVLYRAPLGVNALASGRYLYDSGHEMAIHQRFLNEYNETALYRTLFPYAGRVMQQHIDYRKEMKRKVEDHEYSLVMITAPDSDLEELVDVSDVEAAGYTRLDTITLDMGWASCDVDLWVIETEEAIVLESTEQV
ncbi:MAG: glycosyltransferase family 39 protein [Lachnospiraceae bacterium]|nr:glycosyltransferase family 39 protein [Lachnospiraceae bacterium]